MTEYIYSGHTPHGSRQQETLLQLPAAVHSLRHRRVLHYANGQHPLEQSRLHHVRRNRM